MTKQSTATFIFILCVITVFMSLFSLFNAFCGDSDSLDQTVVKNNLGKNNKKENKTLSWWEAAMTEDEVLLKNFNISSSSSYDGTTQALPSCLLPNKGKTSALVRKVLAENPNLNSENHPLLPLPVMTVGMPKCCSTTYLISFNAPDSMQHTGT